MVTIFMLIGLTGLIVGVISFIKGGMKSLRISNRKISGFVIAGSFCLLIAASAFADTEKEADASNTSETDNEEVAEEPEEETDTNTENADATNESESKEATAEEEDSDLRDLDWVEVSDDVELEDNMIHITGDTNLEDDAVISYEVEHASNPDDWLEGTMEVTDASFEEEVNIEDFNDGDISVWIGFVPNAQPDNITKLFHMDDDDVSDYPFTDEVVLTKSVPVELSGTGDTATEMFTLSEGFAVFDMDHEGGSNFAVKFKNEIGDMEELMVNEIGNYNGKTFAMIPESGEYLLDITADGNWNSHITQTIPDEVESDPTTVEGTGDDVVFLELESGMKRFELSHDGESNFAIKINGSSLLVNELGNYEGSTTETVQDDAIYAFEVIADGNWKIHVE